jgi:hypothetical protein
MKAITKTVFTGLLFFSSSSYPVEIIPLLGYRGGGDYVDNTTDQTQTLESAVRIMKFITAISLPSSIPSRLTNRRRMTMSIYR